MASLLAADVIVVAKVASIRTGSRLDFRGHALRTAGISITDSTLIKGRLNGVSEFTVYIPNDVETEKSHFPISGSPVVGQQRIFS